MTLDDATSTMLAQLGESGAKPLHEMSPEEARGLGGALAEMYGEGPPVHAAEDCSAPARDGHDIPLRVLRPREISGGVIAYHHGGGWIMGAPAEFETFARELAVRTGCTVVLVDYRLAPEHPFPTAVDDSWDALCWIAEHIGELAGTTAPLVIAGDSAGGNLAAVLAQQARDSGGPQLAAQLLICPVTDSDLETESYVDPSNQLVVTQDAMRMFWDHYLPDLSRRSDPRASPARASDLANLPPAVIIAAEHDVLRSEAETYAALLQDAGVPVELRVFEGQMHDFVTFVNVLPASEDCLSFVAEAITSQLG